MRQKSVGPRNMAVQRPVHLWFVIRCWADVLGSADVPGFFLRRNAEMAILGRASPERLSAFSDGVFAVLITVLVLELHAPHEPSIEALLLHWPTWLSYTVSYLFIAIVWINHHYLMRYAAEATPRLVWFNFAHLFAMSLLPFSTAWMANTKLAPQPVAFYAAVFLLVNATYIALILELVPRHSMVWRSMLARSIGTLCLFAVAAVAAVWHPVLGLGICLCCLIAYLRPHPPSAAAGEQ